MNYYLGFNRAATSLLVAPHYIVLSRKLSHYIPVKLNVNKMSENAERCPSHLWNFFCATKNLMMQFSNAKKTKKQEGSKSCDGQIN